jgi:hypothetical protein
MPPHFARMFRYESRKLVVFRIETLLSDNHLIGSYREGRNFEISSISLPKFTHYQRLHTRKFSKQGWDTRYFNKKPSGYLPFDYSKRSMEDAVNFNSKVESVGGEWFAMS